MTDTAPPQPPSNPPEESAPLPAQANVAPSPVTPSPVAVPPRRGSRLLKRYWLLIVVVIAVIVGPIIYRHVTGSPDVASVGNCMTGQTGDALKVVKCGDASAQWIVVGKVDNQVEPLAGFGTARQCDKWPTTGASFWKGKEGDTGYILCLAPKK